MATRALLHADIPYITHYTTVRDGVLVFRSAPDIKETSWHKPVLQGRNAAGDVLYYLPGVLIAQKRIAFPVAQWIANEQFTDWENGSAVRSVEDLLSKAPGWVVSLQDEIRAINKAMDEVGSMPLRQELFYTRRMAMMETYSDLLNANVPAEKALVEVAARCYSSPKNLMKYLKASKDNYYSTANYNKHAKERHRILAEHRSAPYGSLEYSLKILKSMPEYEYITKSVDLAYSQARNKDIEANFTIRDLFDESLSFPAMCPIMNTPLTYKRRSEAGWELPEEYREEIPLYIERVQNKMITEAEGVGEIQRNSFGIVNGVGEKRKRISDFFGNSAVVWRLDISKGLVPGNVSIMSLAGAHKVELDADYLRAKQALEQAVRKGELYE